MNRRRAWLAIGVVFVGALAFGVGFVAHASLPPDDAALVYSGVLEDDGALVDGQRSLNVALFDDDVAGTSLCETGAQSVAFVRGRFKVGMPVACAVALRAPGDAFVEVTLDGESLGRAKISAVPFALAAGEASAATPGSVLEASVDVATASGVPSGAVMAFDLDACPPGWSEHLVARGRTVVGTNPDAVNGLTARARAQQFGVERAGLSVAEMPSHNHGGFTGQPAVQGGGGSAGMDYSAIGAGPFGVQYLQVVNPVNSFNVHRHSIALQGNNLAHENMQPSLALLYCKRD